MREIKFRAWNLDKRKFEDLSNIAIAPEDGKLLRANETDEFIYETGAFELMQYTGLKDKNGKEIYEGDIVKFHAFIEGGGLSGSHETDYNGKGIIEYRDDGMCFVINAKSPYENKNIDWLVQDTSNFGEECFEVIGNIYENPELLDKPIKE